MELREAILRQMNITSDEVESVEILVHRKVRMLLPEDSAPLPDSGNSLTSSSSSGPGTVSCLTTTKKKHRGRAKGSKNKKTATEGDTPGKAAKMIPWINKKIERVRELLFNEKLSEDQELAVRNFLELDPSEWTITRQKQIADIYADTKNL